MKILIATPTSSGQVTTAYAHSLVSACQLFGRMGVGFDHGIFDSADVALARNYFANFIVQHPEFTHILFLDSDMMVSEATFARLLSRRAACVGAVYVERDLNLDLYREAVLAGHADKDARALASRFNVRFDGDEVAVSGGFCRADGIGFGCVLVQRALLDRLAQSGLAAAIRPGRLAREGMTGPVFDFFGALEGPEGERLSEDYAFCRRVRRLGEDVWALVDAEIGHVGRFVYASSFLRRLDATAPARASDPAKQA